MSHIIPLLNLYFNLSQRLATATKESSRGVIMYEMYEDV